jgi:hypothetical protein
MANETLTSGIAGLIDEINAEALVILQDLAGVLDVVRWIDTEGEQGKTLDFPIYGTVASSDVAQVAEGTDHTTNKAISNADTAATVEEHVIKSTISDLSDMSVRSLAAFKQDIAMLFGSAMKAKLEDDVVGLFGSFTQTVAGAATTMTLAHWYDAIRMVKAANGNLMEIAAMISPKQYWGAKGLRSLLVDNSGEAKLSEEFLNKGFVTNPFGMDVLISNEIDEDVAAGGDAAGGIFTKGAIGLHTKGIISIEAERDASLRGYELVGVGRWKQIELVDLWGVYFLSDVA